jgi:uncharacterized protein YbjQ (UPF0145 family)
MSWLDMLIAVLRGATGAGSAAQGAASAARQAEWEKALKHDRLPAFVTARLEQATAGKTPWIATMTPAELALARRRGVRPLAMVSGTCFYHYGYSWTKGHSEGWHTALARLREEALAVGANAVVDVKLRTSHVRLGASMDYTVIGTAVRIDGLQPSSDPIVATVPALEFVRLLESGILPVGIAIGAHYQWLTPRSRYQTMAMSSWWNQPLSELGNFWESVRRKALRELYDDTRRLGTGVLAHTHFGQILKAEGGDKQPPRFLGRHIVIGTVIDERRSGANRPLEIRPVVDMRDAASPLLAAAANRHNAYPVREEGGEI